LFEYVVAVVASDIYIYIYIVRQFAWVSFNDGNMFTDYKLWLTQIAVALMLMIRGVLK